MVNTNNPELYKTLLMLRSHGWAKDLDDASYRQLIKKHNIDDFHKPFTFFVPGFNLRSTDLQAFLGLRQIEKADWVSKRRNENHIRYAQNLLSCVSYQQWGDNVPVSISFGALATNNEHRKRIVSNLVVSGIETRVFSAGNLGVHPFWTDLYGVFEDEVSNKIHSCGFFLPNCPELSLVDIDYICDIVKGS
jgi:CDP-6-deoxy-D-xylo-4-hexulose-3-dehydrase